MSLEPAPTEASTQDLPPEPGPLGAPLATLAQTAPGLYRHYKGNLYQVLGTARHSEDLAAMTIYRALYGERGLWVRPAALFADMVEVDGVVQARFQKISDASA